MTNFIVSVSANRDWPPVIDVNSIITDGDELLPVRRPEPLSVLPIFNREVQEFGSPGSVPNTKALLLQSRDEPIARRSPIPRLDWLCEPRNTELFRILIYIPDNQSITF